jgi:inner membrane transporter RhtA
MRSTQHRAVGRGVGLSVVGTSDSVGPRFPPHLYFVLSASFRYLGPAFAVLLFAHVDVLGVAWMRVASAAAMFALWRRPWRLFRRVDARLALTLIALGVTVAAMNCSFYLAIARVPLGTVGAIEFIGPLALAAIGLRTRRNIAAVGLAGFGVGLLADVRIAGEPLGFAFAFANAALFTVYIVLGHRVARSGLAVIDRLGAAMFIATIVITPIGLPSALPAFSDPVLIGAGVGVGVFSSVIPYVIDQLAMSRLPRATFALMLALLPATAGLIGALVLRQTPTAPEVLGIALVVGGVALHQPSDATR